MPMPCCTIRRMSILVLRHTPGNSLGILEDELTSRGLPYQYLDVFRLCSDPIPLPKNTRGLIALGGPQHVYEPHRAAFLVPELHLLHQAVLAGLPVFGICLGAQLLAKSMGGEARKAPQKEIGWIPLELSDAGRQDPVLSALDEGVPQFQWHEDTYAMPPEATFLAASATCPQQAFKLNERVYGVQFHPEVTPETIDQWLDASGSLSEEQKTRIRQETSEGYDAWSRVSRELFARYCQKVFGD
jgi:GMP synthase (glutamine-hydrolysing)